MKRATFLLVLERMNGEQERVRKRYRTPSPCDIFQFGRISSQGKKKEREKREDEKIEVLLTIPLRLEENRDTRSNKEPREDGRHRAPGQFRIILFHRERELSDFICLRSNNLPLILGRSAGTRHPIFPSLPVYKILSLLDYQIEATINKVARRLFSRGSLIVETEKRGIETRAVFST